METAAGDCWVTVMGNVTLSTQHLQCRTWTRTMQKIFESDDDDVLIKMCCLACQRRVFQRVIPSCYHGHGPQRLPTTRCADWSAQVTLSIAEEAVNWSSLSNVIWIEL